MDIKGMIEQIIAKIKGDKDFEKKFKEKPTKAVESVVGVDLPDAEIDKIVTGVKAKVESKGFLAKIKGLFGKK